MKKSIIEIIREKLSKFENEMREAKPEDFVLVSHTDLKSMRVVLNKLGCTVALHTSKPTNRYIHKGFAKALYQALKDHPTYQLRCAPNAPYACQALMRNLKSEYVNVTILNKIKLLKFHRKRGKQVVLCDIKNYSTKLNRYLSNNNQTKYSYDSERAGNRTSINVKLKQFIDEVLIDDDIFREMFFKK